MQKKTRPLSIKKILSTQPGPLLDLYLHTVNIAIVQEKLHACLPATLREHVLVANYDNRTLHLHTDNAAWATKLRFQIPDILELARHHDILSDLQTIRIRVAPAQGTPARVKKPPKLSPKDAQLLNDAGQSITDRKLRHALMRLAKNNGDRTET